MCYWCNFTDQGEDIRGTKAVMVFYAKIEDFLKQPGGIENITIIAIEPLITYRWTILPGQQENVMKWLGIIANSGALARVNQAMRDEDRSSAARSSAKEDDVVRQRRLMSVLD